MHFIRYILFWKNFFILPWLNKTGFISFMQTYLNFSLTSKIFPLYSETYEWFLYSFFSATEKCIRMWLIKLDLLSHTVHFETSSLLFFFVEKVRATACCSSLASGEIVLGSPVRLLPVMCHLKALWNLPSWLCEPNNNKSALCATCSTHLGGFKYSGVTSSIPPVWCHTPQRQTKGWRGSGIFQLMFIYQWGVCASFLTLVKEQTYEW